MLICCASGGGKTNYLLNLLALFNNTFTKIIISTKAEEQLYNYLIEKIKKGLEVYYDAEIPEIVKMPNGQSGLLVLDDLVLDRKPEVGQMFIRGRKLHYSTIYITQSYFQTEKIIRLNVNYIAYGFGMMRRDLKLALSEYSMNISLDELVDIYNECTKEKMNFMLIDLETRTIRKNITQIIKEF